MTDRQMAKLASLAGVAGLAISLWAGITSRQALTHVRDAERARYSLTQSAEAAGTRLTLKLALHNIGRFPAHAPVTTLWGCRDTSTCAIPRSKNDVWGHMELGSDIEPDRILTMTVFLDLNPQTITCVLLPPRDEYGQVGDPSAPPQVLTMKAPRDPGQVETSSPVFLVLRIRYDDPELGKTLTDTFYRKFRGIEDGKWVTELAPVSAAEKEGLDRAIAVKP